MDLYQNNNTIVVCHGNGPQVGMIAKVFEEAKTSNKIEFNMPFPEEGAMSQGYIGYHIINAIKNEAKRRKVEVNASSLITQTVVLEDDKSFANPTKPIGNFYTKEEAEILKKENGWIIKQDSNRGYRRVVPSPKPIDIVEKHSVKTLMNANDIVICGGGGGIPVIQKNGEYIGVSAVIDKDFTSAKIAELMNADALIILTAVDKIYLNYGKPNAEIIDEINVKDLRKHMEDGAFAEGSMKPKVEALIDFVEKTQKTGYISDLKLSKELLLGKAGTLVVY